MSLKSSVTGCLEIQEYLCFDHVWSAVWAAFLAALRIRFFLFGFSTGVLPAEWEPLERLMVSHLVRSDWLALFIPEAWACRTGLL